MHKKAACSIDQALRSAWHHELKAISDTTIKQRCPQQESELLPRFAEYYETLKALRRRVRRRLLWQCKRSLAGIALIWTLGQGPALAATTVATGVFMPGIPQLAGLSLTAPL